MAIKQSGTGVDYGKVGVLKDFLMNPVTIAQRDTLASALGAAHKGLPVTVTDLNGGTLQIWTGAAFTSVGSSSGLTPKGSVAFGATEPVSPAVGDLYVFNTAGSNTWETATPVQVGDQIWWDGANWNIIQGNVLAAAEAIAGVIALATQAEVNTGTEAAKAVTPATLAGYIASRKSAKVYFASSVTTVADTPLTIAHALALQNRDAFVLSFKVGNSEVEVDVDSTDINNCTITTSVAMTGSITVIGF